MDAIPFVGMGLDFLEGQDARRRAENAMNASNSRWQEQRDYAKPFADTGLAEYQKYEPTYTSKAELLASQLENDPWARAQDQQLLADAEGKAGDYYSELGRNLDRSQVARGFAPGTGSGSTMLQAEEAGAKGQAARANALQRLQTRLAQRKQAADIYGGLASRGMSTGFNAQRLYSTANAGMDRNAEMAVKMAGGDFNNMMNLAGFLPGMGGGRPDQWGSSLPEPGPPGTFGI